jgi:hypothetical protein
VIACATSVSVATLHESEDTPKPIKTEASAASDAASPQTPTGVLFFRH